jgi:D-alanyl-D-alanine carboxypeptidase (penicillin-binding protein 5/6)
VYALAEYLGGGGGEAGVDGFVEKANKEAEDLGLEDTHFQNPAGLDARGQYSSARNLAEMTREAMKYPEFREIVGKIEATIGTQNRQIETATTNQLLYDYKAATGVKTGTSADSGPCVVASAERGDESYIGVVLGASSDLERFEAARTVLEYGFDAYDRRPLVNKGNTYETLTLPYRPGETVGLAAAEDVPGPAGPGLELKKRIIAGKAPAEVRAGQKLGTIEVFVDGQSMGTSPLVANRGYREASPWQRARRAVAWPAERLWAVIGGWISKRVADPA